MFEPVLRRYLQWTGKKHLLPLVSALSRAGRPAAVPFPPELLDQGLAIVLSGLNNTLAVQSNPDWVWPYWVERQTDPDGEAFLPTAINLIKNNLTHRNWTSVGVDDNAVEAMVDPVGMITLRPYGWSFFPYLRTAGGLRLPPRLGACVRQTLEDGWLSGVRTDYDNEDGLEWSLDVRASRYAQGDWLLARSRLKNRSGRHQTLAFGWALRPYNALMLGPINSVLHRQGAFRVNGEWSLFLGEEPERVRLSDRRGGDPLVDAEAEATGSAGGSFLRSAQGLATALAETSLELAAGQEVAFHAFGNLNPNHRRPRAPRARADFEAAWEAGSAADRDRDAVGLRLEFPDPRWTRAFRALKARLPVFDDGAHFSPGTFLYHQHWFRDSAFLALAFDQIGWGERVGEKFPAALSKQTAQGFFRSQNGEWDSNGQALFTLIGHVRRGGDPERLEQAYPALLRGAEWIRRMCDRSRTAPSPHYGLLPAGFSAEHFGPNDHYYWDAFWSVAGLEHLGWAARLFGKAEDGDRVSRILADCRSDLEASIDAAFRRTGCRGLPSSPYRNLDSACIGNLVAASPLEVVAPDAAWLRCTVDHLMRHHLRDGLFFQRIVHTGLNAYLSVQLARALQRLRDPRAETVLEAVLQAGGPLLTWPEAIHPRTGGGCMGDGDHGWAAAEMLNLLRDCAVREDRGRLLLAGGASPAWYMRPGNLSVRAAPTLYGTVTYALAWDETSLTLDWKVERAPHQETVPLLFHLPWEARRLYRFAAESPPAPSGDRAGSTLTLESDRGTLRLAAEAAPASGASVDSIPSASKAVSHV